MFDKLHKNRYNTSTEINREGDGVKKFLSVFFLISMKGGIFQSVGTAGWIVTAFVLIVVGLFIQLLEAIKEK